VSQCIQLPADATSHVHVASQFMLTAWRRVFTPFQVAQLTVQTYPNNADILAMIKCADSFCNQVNRLRTTWLLTHAFKKCRIEGLSWVLVFHLPYFGVVMMDPRSSWTQFVVEKPYVAVCLHRARPCP